MSGAAIALLWQLALQGPEPPLAEAVQWVAPAGCPDREALLAGVARRRGRALAPGEAKVAGQVTAKGKSYRLELAVDVAGRRETRVLTARRCSALVDAAALLIVVAVDADAPPAPVDPVGPPPELPPEPTTEPTATIPAPPGPGESPNGAPAAVPVPPPSDIAPPGPTPPLETAPPDTDAPLEPPRPRAPARSRRPGGFVRAHGVGEYGALPGVTGGVGLAGGLLWRRIRVELQATYLAPREVAHPEGQVRAFLLAGAALGCARLGRGVIEVPLCAGLEAGAQHGAVRSPGRALSGYATWVAAVVSAGVAWRAHPRMSLWAAVQGLASPRPPRFFLEKSDGRVELFDPGVLSARVNLGIELRFGDPR